MLMFNLRIVTRLWLVLVGFAPFWIGCVVDFARFCRLWSVLVGCGLFWSALLGLVGFGRLGSVLGRLWFVSVGFFDLGRFWFGPFGAVVVGFGRLVSVLFTLVGFGRFWIGCGRPW